jgi:diguanylate cyclase (GGDEF)-like protein
MTKQQNSLDQKELEAVRLFKGVAIESIQPLLEGCPVKRLKQGEVLLHAGSSNHFIYALLSGRLRVHLDKLLEPVALLEAGEIVGEISVIDGQPTSAHVVADEECRVLVLDEKTTWSLMPTSTEVAFNLLVVLAERLRGGNSVISSSQVLQREYKEYALIDALTGLYNRRWLDMTLPNEMQFRTHQSLSILLIDVNEFKPYNDTYGHLAGDHVLQMVAATLKGHLRSGKTIARHGGDEFVVVLPDAVEKIAQEVGKRLRKAVGETGLGSSDWRDLPPVSISVGWAEMISGDTPRNLISRADESLYRAKEERHNAPTSG